MSEANFFAQLIIALLTASLPVWDVHVCTGASLASYILTNIKTINYRAVTDVA